MRVNFIATKNQMGLHINEKLEFQQKHQRKDKYFNKSSSKNYYNVCNVKHNQNLFKK